MTRRRLDVLLVERGLATSREQARRLILAGQVRAGDRVADKTGALIAEDSALSVAAPPPFVSRGGLKLAAALDAFALDVRGLVAADVGASTGGCTDCLLQRGAARIYAIDVGYGQLAWALRQDPRVVVMERTNIRYLEVLPEPCDLATVDVSFISLRLVLPAVRRLLKPQGFIVALVKPQFEAGRGQVGKGGVVRDAQVHRRVLNDLLEWSQGAGFAVRGLVPSPLLGPAGNVEFLLYLIMGNPGGKTDWGDLAERCLADAPKPRRAQIAETAENGE
ncbi:MAG: TlyA family RNA methyltransferase [Anaerolineae bacterium]|nr:TlyA family RNA methyltransferase [Anaerolineae bacterium]